MQQESGKIVNRAEKIRAGILAPAATRNPYSELSMGRKVFPLHSPLHPCPPALSQWSIADKYRGLLQRAAFCFKLWMVVQQFPWEGVKSFLCYRGDVRVILSRLCSSTIWIAFALEGDSVFNQV